MTMCLSEIWKRSLTLPAYDVSSFGRVRRRPFRRRMPNGGTRQYGGNAHRGQWDGQRYIFVYRGCTYKVARLVCEAFHGRRPFRSAVAMHRNENSRINRADNLEWGTQKQNLNAPRFLAYAARVCPAKMRGKNGPF